MDGTIFAIVCVLLFAGVLVVKYRKYNIHRALALPKNPPRYPDSAMRSAREIGKFLFERADVCGVYFMTADKDTGVSYEALRDISDGKDTHIVNFIRMAHFLGCEVVIRQIGTSDTENPDTTPQVYAELIANIEEEIRR
jgi:hypothetical protein